MTVHATTMYCARCDAPGCEALSSDYEVGNNRVYDDPAILTEKFTDTHEGSIGDDYGWLLVVDNSDPAAPVETHFCGQHTTWDEDLDIRVPDLQQPTIASITDVSESEKV